MPSSSAALVELINVNKFYGGQYSGKEKSHESQPEVQVLDNISLKIHAGEFVAIVGTSGSGKSSLMNILGCLDRPSSGEYRFAGHDVADLNSDQLAWLRREAFGFIFQSYHLIPSESASENVEVPALYAGLSEQQRREKSHSLLRRLGLADRLNNKPNQLSGGQQQRVSIARALMNGGCIILADEPTGALDSTTGAEVMDLLQELALAGHTIILITHDKEVAQRANRIIEIRDGEIISDQSQSTESSLAQTQQSALLPPDISNSDASKGGSLFLGLHNASRSAKRVMLANPFRTTLTLLGIIIGVASVIVMMSIAEGAKRDIREQMGTFGSNTMYLEGKSPSPQAPEGIITLADLKMLEQLPEVTIVEPTLGSTKLIRYGKKDHRSYTRTASINYPIIYHWPVAEGRFFNEDEIQRAVAVAVIGLTVRQALFEKNDDPIGKFILVGNNPFQIIGVLNKKDNNGGNWDRNDQVAIPYSTAITRVFGPTDPEFIGLSVSEDYPLEHSEKVIIETLTRLHNGVVDFELENSAASQKSTEDIMGKLSLMLGSIAAVSLLVGGIGVMNVMLMTVRERTREIGIRMATGARQRDILRQFLAESVLLSIVGGIMGILLAFAILLIAVLLIDDVPVLITPLVVGGAFSSALITGVIFGFTPAKKAAQLDPVIALASE
ncbi:MAG: macrolide ABC transporter permease/ATP-binding protein MacB [Gammaproteobacteria bacterium]|nr:MAG: macrolide ABC transporter permease/ATP-binding protein MacB [Gammaproteobacteria bacterium]